MGTAASCPVNADILRPPPGYVLDVPSLPPTNNSSIGARSFDSDGDLAPQQAGEPRDDALVTAKMENGGGGGKPESVCHKRSRAPTLEGFPPDDGPLRKRRAGEAREATGGGEADGAVILGDLTHGVLSPCAAGPSTDAGSTATHALDIAVSPAATDISTPNPIDPAVEVDNNDAATAAAAAAAAAVAAAAADAAAVAAEVTAAANAVDAAFMSFPTAHAGEVAMSPPAEVGVDTTAAHHPGDISGFSGVPMSTIASATAAPVSPAVGIAPPSHSLSSVGVSPSSPVLTPGASPYSTMASVLPASYSFLPMPTHGLLGAGSAVTSENPATSAAVSVAVGAAANAVFVSQNYPVAVPTVTVPPDLGTLGAKDVGAATIAPDMSGPAPSPLLASMTPRSSGYRRRNSETQDSEPPRRNRSRPTCTAEGCQQRPLFGIEGTKQAIFCSQHKAPGMTNVLCRRCEVEGCKHQPSFAVEGSRAVRCATHKTPDMVNVAAPRCKSPGCMVCPSFGKQGERKASFCATHRREGDVDLVTRRCHHEGCVHRPVFGHPPEKKAYYCASHKLDGMVNVFAPRCAFPNCTHQPSFGLPGSKRSTHCGKHRSEFHENKR